MRAATITFVVTLMVAASLFSAHAQDAEAPLYDAEKAGVSQNNTTGERGNGNETPAESCRASCNRDFENCGDEGAASDQSMNGRPSAGFSKNHCNASLVSCMKGCKGL